MAAVRPPTARASDERAGQDVAAAAATRRHRRQTGSLRPSRFASAREDFEWLRRESDGAGGEASVFSADMVDTWSNDALVEECRRSREEAYSALATDAEKVARRFTAAREKSGIPSRRLLEQLRERLAAIERIDFFGTAGRDRVLAAIRQIEDRASSGSSRGRIAHASTNVALGSLWVTRPRPGVDRMSSAWLIRKFIDPDARFDFITDREQAPADAMPFDMFGVEFTHHGELCTFEFLRETFDLKEAALTRIAAIVHDLDLKDGRFGASEAPALGAVIDGLRLAHADDAKLLSDGITLFEALYRSFEQAGRASGPRGVAKTARKMRSTSRK